MCGIVGYTGKNSALTPVLDGLRRLEYRGYDSAGIALTTQVGKPLYVEKQAGKLKNLEEFILQKDLRFKALLLTEINIINKNK